MAWLHCSVLHFWDGRRCLCWMTSVSEAAIVRTVAASVRIIITAQHHYGSVGSETPNMFGSATASRWSDSGTRRSLGRTMVLHDTRWAWSFGTDGLGPDRTKSARSEKPEDDWNPCRRRNPGIPKRAANYGFCERNPEPREGGAGPQYRVRIHRKLNKNGSFNKQTACWSRGGGYSIQLSLQIPSQKRWEINNSFNNKQ